MVGSDDGAAGRFEDESLQRLDATVLLSSRTFVRLELPAPWASTTIPLPSAELAKGEAVRVAGRPDADLDQLRAPRPGEAVVKQPGFRVLVVELPGSRYAEVPWPPEGQPDVQQPGAEVADDENDWSDV